MLYAADGGGGIGSSDRSTPSVVLVGSKIRRRSSAALVGEVLVTSRRPSSTSGRSAGHKAVTAALGSAGAASGKISLNATGPVRNRPSSSSRKKVGLRLPASSGERIDSPA